jgi:excisionase family DNA binding protein
MTNEKYLKPEEVAERYQVSRRMVYKMVALGQLKAIKFGGALRIPESALTEFVKPAKDVDDVDD